MSHRYRIINRIKQGYRVIKSRSIRILEHDLNFATLPSLNLLRYRESTKLPLPLTRCSHSIAVKRRYHSSRRLREAMADSANGEAIQQSKDASQQGLQRHSYFPMSFKEGFSQWVRSTAHESKHELTVNSGQAYPPPPPSTKYSPSSHTSNKPQRNHKPA